MSYCEFNPFHPPSGTNVIESLKTQRFGGSGRGWGVLMGFSRSFTRISLLAAGRHTSGPVGLTPAPQDLPIIRVRGSRGGSALTSPALTLGERSTFLDRISPATRTRGQQEEDWTDLVVGAVCSI